MELDAADAETEASTAPKRHDEPANLGRSHANSDTATTTTTDVQVVETIFRAARYYGFRNIQNLVRKLRPVPAKSRLLAAAGTNLVGARQRVKRSKLGGGSVGNGSNGTTSQSGTNGSNEVDGDNPGSVSASGYHYIEVMACPGGCTNGGGQIKGSEVDALLSSASASASAGSAAKDEEMMDIDHEEKGVDVGGSAAADRPSSAPPPPPTSVSSQKEWLSRVDEAYFSAPSSSAWSSGKETAEPIPRDIDNGTSSLNVGGNLANPNDPADGTDDTDETDTVIFNISRSQTLSILKHWSGLTGGCPISELAYTTFRNVVDGDGAVSGDVATVTASALSSSISASPVPVPVPVPVPGPTSTATAVPTPSATATATATATPSLAGTAPEFNTNTTPTTAPNKHDRLNERPRRKKPQTPQVASAKHARTVANLATLGDGGW